MPNPKDDPKSPEWRPYIFARDRRFQEITPAEALIRHIFLPASGSTSWCQRSFLAWVKMRHFRLRRQGCSVQGLLRPISKVAMVCQRLEVVQVVAILADWSSQRVASVVHNRGRSRARGRNPNAGATQRRRTNLGRAACGWALLFCDFSEAVTGCGASSVPLS